jgi:hypothetical protein
MNKSLNMLPEVRFQVIIPMTGEVIDRMSGLPHQPDRSRDSGLPLHPLPQILLKINSSSLPRNPVLFPWNVTPSE